MNLELNKKYIRRDGVIVEIIGYSKGFKRPFVSNAGDSYFESGLHDENDVNHRRTIVAKYAEQDEPCNTEDAVIALIRKRGKVGRQKYKCSMDRKDLHPDEWIEHHQQELADALQYAERMKGMAELLHQARDMVMTILHERGWETAEDWVRRYHEQFMPREGQKNI